MERYKSEAMKYILQIQSELLHTTYNYFINNGFKYILPVMLSTEMDNLNGDVEEAYIEYYNQKLYLMKSMIIQKELALTNKELDRVFTISQCVRLEKKDKYIKGRHLLEFQQIDFEIRNGNTRELFDFVEKYIIEIFNNIKCNCQEALSFFAREIIVPQRPFLVMDNAQLCFDNVREPEALVSNYIKFPCWVRNYKRWIFDKEIHKDNQCYNENFDLLFPEGFCEVGSGSERETNYDTLIEKDGFKTQNFTLFEYLIKENKIQNSVGMGIGVQRLMRYFIGDKIINNVLPFSRDIDEDIII